MLDVENLFDNGFDLLSAKALLKEIQKEEKLILKKISLEQKFSLTKQEKEEIKKLPYLKGVFLSKFIKVDKIMEYFSLVEKDFKFNFDKETERAFLFLNNEEEAEKAGWNCNSTKKSVVLENEKKQLEWCHKAYPNIFPDVWLINFEKELLIKYMKSVN